MFIAFRRFARISNAGDLADYIAGLIDDWRAARAGGELSGYI